MTETPHPGPLAVLPSADPLFVDAVRSAGGTVAPLSSATRGIVWLDNAGGAGLDEVLDSHPAVDWVQLPWAGVDAFAEVLRRHDRPGRVWTSAKGAYARPVAEHALTLLLGLLRLMPTRIRADSWGGKGGTSLHGLHVLIVGAGGIAQELLRLLRPFGVDVTMVRRKTTAVPDAARTVGIDRLDEALASADVVVLAAPLTPATTGLFDAQRIARLKPGAYLVNVARGAFLDTDALVAALDDGRLAGAGLDVTDPEPLPDGHPLWRHPSAIVTPHTADTPEMTRPLLADRVRANVGAYLDGGGFTGVVDPGQGY
ncbi:D-isomer specific 2-hydroxyacid dehydrogenase family protein [Herbiconiux sp. A18JL235]|uniref:D-isomer specific 2-hydroxyacid dehydrogenase family protein n=1 Tax=Herbiconiux sp. A18JL235 TaxID=3152363 RepID=A0AB39BLN7_9MICO